MMTPTCDAVAERIALGEVLGELTEHVSTCERCQRVVELPARLGATRTPIDPGLGFAARMTAGAQHRVAVRRRRRVAVGIASSLAATVAVVVLVTRAGDVDHVDQRAAAQPRTIAEILETALQPAPPLPIEPSLTPAPHPDDPAPPTQTANADLAALALYSDVKRVRRLGAHWTKIERPLAPYRHLVSSLKGVTP